ncbi:DNA-polymerase III subunit alpha [Sesbania bispinosa]|nr:DNA-polymerase III subunit alpha [Sesbania bispinosa]
MALVCQVGGRTTRHNAQVKKRERAKLMQVQVCNHTLHTLDCDWDTVKFPIISNSY